MCRKHYKDDVVNHGILTYEGKTLGYDGLFTLIQDMDYQKIGSTDFRVFRAEDAEKGIPCIVVMFQESLASDKDWENNFRFLPTLMRLRGKKEKVYDGWENRLWYHSGFLDEYQDARDEIVSQVDALIAQIAKEQKVGRDVCKYTVLVTGWSLGGSIAPICAEDMNYQFAIKPVLVCYEGANPCASIHTRNYIYECIDLDRSISFENASDIVCRCPPLFGRRLWKTIRHLGRSFCITDCIKNTAHYHCHVAEAIREDMGSL